MLTSFFYEYYNTALLLLKSGLVTAIIIASIPTIHKVFDPSFQKIWDDFGGCIDIADLDINMDLDSVSVDTVVPKKEIIKQVVKFEDRYLEKFEKLGSSDLSEDQLKGLKNNIVMENTPDQGNILMFYDHSRGSFTYFADHTIPYRYLEVVVRKYVNTYHCKQIYFDMKKELELAEQKIMDKKEKEKEKQKEEEIRKQEEKERIKEGVEGIKETNKESTKVNVFAKLKSYNTGSGSTNVTTGSGAGAKSGLGAGASSKAETNANRSTNVNTNVKQDYIVKENANRYSYEGKLANYSLLKKPSRKDVDKNYGMSFADFKRRTEENKVKE